MRFLRKLLFFSLAIVWISVFIKCKRLLVEWAFALVFKYYNNNFLYGYLKIKHLDSWEEAAVAVVVVVVVAVAEVAAQAVVVQAVEVLIAYVAYLADRAAAVEVVAEMPTMVCAIQ